MPTITWEYEDDDGGVTTVDVPAVWEICCTCQGEGKSSDYLGAITEEDRDRDWDPEEWQGYLTGAYDKTCAECKGTGKVKVIDMDAFEHQNPKAAEAYVDHQTCLASLRAEEAMERRYGC